MPGWIQLKIYLNGFTPNSNSTSQIQLVKFDRAGIQCNLNDLHPIQIRPVEFNRAFITGQIG